MKNLSLIPFLTILVVLLFTPPLIADELGKAGAAERKGAAKKGPRDGDQKPAEAGKADAPEGKKDAQPAAQLNTKEGKVFSAYDKNDDGSVTAEEMASMREGKQNSRAKREFRKAVDRADKDEDGKLNLDEFAWWYKVGRTNEREKNR